MDELTSVKDYLYRQTSLNLGRGNKHVSSSVIFLIEAIPPPKAAVLAYLDNAQPAPQRAAQVDTVNPILHFACSLLCIQSKANEMYLYNTFIFS